LEPEIPKDLFIVIKIYYLYKMWVNFCNILGLKNSINDWLLANFYLFFLVIVTVIILCLVYILAKQNRHYDIEKISAYECGFEPFGEARFPFNVHFYVVALIFLIFDLEVAFLVPWSSTLWKFGFESWYNMMVFLIIVNVGFVYEIAESGLRWKTYALESDHA